MGSLPEDRRFKADNVCIIGAGPSGLAAAKYLLAERTFSRIQIYEQRSTVGGIWIYVPHRSPSPYDVEIPQTNPFTGAEKPIWRRGNAMEASSQHGQEEAVFMTPLYDRLETNIPRGLMGFSDLEWPEDSQLFPRHETVLGYIERYAENVKHLIQFRRQVLDVSLARDERWLVKTQAVSREGSDIVEETFDAVIVANGHYNVPYIPEVPGIERWSAAYPGTISHSKFYRNPDQYAGKKVIVVGNSASGIDIGAQIQPVCKPPMLLSSKSESMMANAASPTQMDKPPIAEYIVEDRTVRFDDGTTESGIDAILYCTGYFYSLPFLESLHPPLITSGENVERLYQHIFYQQRPTLALMALNQKVIPFPLAEAQAAVIACVFSGRLSLPDAAEMAAWERQWRKANGDGRMFHVLKYPKDADYINMLHDWTQEADGETSPGGRVAAKSNDVGEAVGKIPPYWGEREYWTRERSPAMKKAFQDLGEDRHGVRSLEQLGFDFEKWKAENER